MRLTLARLAAAFALLTFGTAGAAMLSILAAWIAAPLLLASAWWIAARPRS